jgi:SecD/SecF fusion protein
VSPQRRNGLILLLVSGILAVSAVVIAIKPTVLGLDLKGGVELVYQGRPSAAQPQVTQDALDRSVEIMRDRVDQLGVSEPEIQRSGRDQIAVALPGVSNVSRAEKQVGTPAQLAFYDWERSLLLPDGKTVATGLTADNQRAQALSIGGAVSGPGGRETGLGLYDAVKQAAKRKPINDGDNFRLGKQYWAFAPKTHKWLAGPADSLVDLKQERRFRSDAEIIAIQPGTILLQATDPDKGQGTPPPINRPDLARWYVMEDDPALLGKDVKDPKQETDNSPGGTGRPVVTFKFTKRGRQEFQGVTRQVAQRGQSLLLPGRSVDQVQQHFSIALDRKLISVASIDPKRYPDGIDGSTGAQIEGNFTIQQAQDLASLIKLGALPINLKLISKSTVSATLGKEALHQGLLAGALGFGVVVLFLLAFYRLLGLIAALCLGVYAVYFFALIKLIPITLTLPGIAGLILTIGVAADANIVIFERVKEEVRAGRSIPAAIAAGYKKGLTAIVDANVVTLMTAFILFILATSGVRGFAFTLGVGTVVSLFTAVLATQAILGAMGRSRLVSSPAALGAKGEGRRITFDFMGASKWFFSMSGLILLVGALSIGGKGLNFGIDFKSGTRIQSTFAKNASEDGVRSVLAPLGYGDAKVQRVNGSGARTSFQITAKIPPNRVDTVKNALDARFGVVESKFGSDSVGPTFGQTVATSALYAIIASLLVISAYIALRFEWKYAVPVLIALMHDVLITSGVYSLTGREVTTATVAALLTILGYSLYDTIIVFDRVRENVPRMPRAAFSQIVNRSMSEVITRSLATSFCTLLPVVALLLFGGETLKDFAFALLVGVASGAYSSIFIASPVLTHWKEREPVYRARRRRIAAELGSVPAYATDRSGMGLEVEPVQPEREPTRLSASGPDQVSRSEFEKMKAELGLEDDAPAAPDRRSRRQAPPVATRPRPTGPPRGNGGTDADEFRRAPDEPENEGVAREPSKPKRPRNRRHGRNR